ncbi:hypothetical protein [Streptomyces sp. NRRL S-337]|uniref:hypothetical protein n=1 Tax=Streptomyces sp. NRRL S-337 TaxID=1463900 RepID=UPI0004C87662|nr:hypothetical protein [Streptomyces sp. NRRL S-337]
MEYLQESAGKTDTAAVPAPSIARPRPRRTGRPCSCAEPELTAVILGQPHPAEPAGQMTPASIVHTASCRACGGSYNKPWRRSGAR